MIRNFSSESMNPREQRAYAHAMIESVRRREVPRRVAEVAVLAASQTRKGTESGFDEALDVASSYEAVRGTGSAYRYLSWPYPPQGSEKHHMVFERLDNDRTRNPVRYADEAWPVIRDELVTREYGLHDAGHGIVVAVVLDRELEVTDLVEIFKEHGWIGRDDPLHQTSFC